MQTTLAQPPRERLHGLDAVRGIALLLGLVVHASMAWIPGAQYFWVTHDGSPGELAGLLFYVPHMFRMLLFFLVQIALRAMEAPLREIVTNAGEEPSVIVNKVKEGTGSFGYNAATGQFGDMLEMGILDPTKVTRTALQNAASIAGLMITTEAMVGELPKKDEKAAGAGMGGMGDMDF